jgi:hypothetical protein
MKRTIPLLALAPLFALHLAACGSDVGEGDVEFTVWGEEYIEEGIPEAEFEDGFSVRYDKFLIVLGDVEVAGGEGGAQTIEGARLYDLTKPGPHEMGTLKGIREGAHREVSYRNPAADGDTERHRSATNAQLEAMRDGGLRLSVSGTAESPEGDEFTFAWGFSGTVEYSDCVDVRGGQETHGIVVGDRTTEEHELTIHGDHLFYDDLASPDARLRFAALARADANADGEVTLEELDEVRLASLSSKDGSYGVGAFDIDDLGAFVRATTHTVGHFDGEGHCVARER